MGRRRSNTAFRNGVAVWVYDSDSDTETVRARSRQSSVRRPLYADSTAPRKRSGTVLRDGVPLLLGTDDSSQERELYRGIGVRTVPAKSVAFVWDDYQNLSSDSDSDDDYSPLGRSARRISELSLRRGGYKSHLYDTALMVSKSEEEKHHYGNYRAREARRMSEYSTYGYFLGAEVRRVGYRPSKTHEPSMTGGRTVERIHGKRQVEQAGHHPEPLLVKQVRKEVV